jgi:hypothetical protein
MKPSARVNIIKDKKPSDRSRFLQPTSCCSESSTLLGMESIRVSDMIEETDIALVQLFDRGSQHPEDECVSTLLEGQFRNLECQLRLP